MVMVHTYMKTHFLHMKGNGKMESNKVKAL